jgi:hypothetical protein
MAIIDNKGIIRGAVGPSVFRHSRGKNIIQSKPGKYKQTAASIASSAEFGLINSSAAIIRHAFEPAYRYYDGRVVGRMTSAVGRSVRSAAGTICGQRDLHDGDLSYLLGTEFNKNSLLKDVLPVQPQISRDDSGAVVVQMPALNMKTDLKLSRELMYKGYKMKVRFLLIAFNFRESYYEFIDSQDLEYLLSKNAGARELTLSGDIPQGCMLLLSMSVSLYGCNALDEGFVLLNSKAFSPAALVAAWQEPGIIPLEKATTGPAEERPRQVVIDYAGYQLLKGLQKRIEQKARPGTAKLFAEKMRQNAKNPRQPDQDDYPEVVKGKRVRFI